MLNNLYIIDVTVATLCRTVPVVVWFERAILIQAQVLGLIIRKLRQVGIKSGQMQTGNIFIWNKCGLLGNGYPA